MSKFNMSKFKGFGIISLCAIVTSSLNAVTKEEKESAQNEIMAGVNSIDVGGGALPGCFIIFGEDAFPLAECRNYDKTTAFSAVGAFCGKGRALFMSHPMFAELKNLQRDTPQMITNAVNWLVKGKVKPKIAVCGSPSTVGAWSNICLGEVSRVKNLDNLNSYDLLVCNGNNSSREDTDKILSFIKNGGSYISGPLGWGFLFYQPNVCFADAFNENRVMGEMGILMNTMGVTRVGDNGFPKVDLNKIPNGTFVEDALAILLGEKQATKEETKQAMATLTVLINGLPSGVHSELYSRLMAISDRPEAKRIPSPDAPIGAESVFSRLAILAYKSSWLANLEKPIPANKAAEVYPGLVKEGTPKIEKSIKVNLSVPRWHSTGVFAPAGEGLTVKISKDAIARGLKVRIGSTADDVSGLSEWKRHPLVTCECELKKEETTVYSPFGGLVYIVVPDVANLSGEEDVKISGGVMAPWYRYGIDTKEDFAKQCRETGAPYGEIQGKEFIITSEVESMRKVADIEAIAKFWDGVLSEFQKFAKTTPRRYPERICSDVQLTGGWLHAGYPIMTYQTGDHFDWVMSQDLFDSGDIWGVAHEIGHNHQSHDWTPMGMGEVTVNLFTTLAIEKCLHRNYRENRYPCGTQAAKKRVKAWVVKGKKFEGLKGDYFLGLEFFLRLKEAYGWEMFQKAFATYCARDFRKPANDQGKWDMLAKSLSVSANANIAEAMTEWSIPISEEVKAFCKKFPAPKEMIFAGLKLEPYKGPNAVPVKGEYMAINLEGKNAGSIELFESRDKIPGGEKDKRWKTKSILMRRIEPTSAPFTLGNRDADKESSDAPHDVTFSKPYYIGVYEITQEQYYYVMGEWRKNCIGGVGDREMRPINGISYYDVRGGEGDGIDWPRTGGEVLNDSFLGRLRALTGYRGEFDLPTEAQWEYAGRALTTGKWNNGVEENDYKDEKGLQRNKNLDKLGRYANNGGDCGKAIDMGKPTQFGTANVGSYEPNAWGIYDMHGNVYEWCRDWCQSIGKNMDAYSGEDPKGPLECEKTDKGKEKPRRTMRGGSWWNTHLGRPVRCVIWDRSLGSKCHPSIAHGAVGFRIVVPGAIASEASDSPNAYKLSKEGREIRKTLLDGVTVFEAKGLPTQIFICDSRDMITSVPREYIPLVVGKNWTSGSSCVALAAKYGKGKFILIPDSVLTMSGDNKKFFENVKKWFNASCENVDLSKLTEDDIKKLTGKIASGGCYVFYGNPSVWKANKAEKGENLQLSQWIGNKLMENVGLRISDFTVRRTANGGFATRSTCDSEALETPTDFFAIQKFATPTDPAILTPAKKRHVSGVLANDGETIAFLGDSITRLGAGKSGYISLVMKGLEIAGVKNLDSHRAGCDGNHAGDMRGRLGGILANPEVKVLTISCGVNDIWGYAWGRGQRLEEYKENVRAMYDRAARAGVQVVALTPTLIEEDPANEWNRLLDPFADFIREEAKRRGLPIADCRAAEIEALKKFPKDNTLHFTYDGVHPIWEGNKLIAKEVLKAFGVSSKYDEEIAKAWEEMKE